MSPETERESVSPTLDFGSGRLKGTDFTLREFASAGVSSLSLHSTAAPTDKIIVGVDYGTTFTGASYVHSKATDINDIVVISSWPGPTRDTETVFKAPSRIAYASENPRASKNRWGFQVEPGMTGYSWTKLLLDQGSPVSIYDDASLETTSQKGIMQLPEGKSAVQVVTDYLAEIYKHILNTIAKAITEEKLRVTPMEFWFTLPAIWSDRAQSATRTAAQQAGFGSSMLRPSDRIFMISEPEAAAVATLKKYTSNSAGGGAVKAGDGVLVCDCGGGTVDITTYLIEETSPLRFEELCTGIGGKCGSTAVDRDFLKLMSSRFGAAFDCLPAKRKGPGSEFMKKFESLKRDFGASDEDMVFELPLNMTLVDPDPTHYDEDERLVIISSEDIRKCFSPVVDQIVQLIKKQIDESKKEAGKEVINRIVLVGGFGDSEHLRSVIRTTFETDGKIAVTVPEIPQAAVVRGAALSGLEGLRSTSKRCRRHYGFSVNEAYRPGVDDVDSVHSYWDTYTDTRMVSGIMMWIVHKGQRYTPSHTESFPLKWKAYPNSESTPSIKLYASDRDVEPARCDSEGVYEVGNIVINLGGVDKTKFDSRVINGVRVYMMHLQFRVVFGALEGVLRVEATSQGKRIGETSVHFSKINYY